MEKNDIEEYLIKFDYGKNLDRNLLIKEIDQIWDDLSLDNNLSLSSQQRQIAEFYSHPVWILNGLFSDHDFDSRNHRIAIAKKIVNLNLLNVADFGGGSGVLAKYISQENNKIQIDIIEPYPAVIFTNQYIDNPNIKYVPNLNKEYDLIIAQDVLEHVDYPMDLAIQLIINTKINGFLFFANCFMPEIKCHVPGNFYLRITFKFIVQLGGLKYIGTVENANHVQIFLKTKTSNFKLYKIVNKILYKSKIIFFIYEKLKFNIKKILIH
jgi:2-polyprenyl-3-methyl-5-hydroxy-6-metoxy-1,4-benzoquinol methylase